MASYIGYKGIIHNVLNDAPFIGAIVIAKSCHYGCEHCINDHLKNTMPMLYDPPEAILQQVLANGLNEGIIFSGLEWTEQPKDLYVLTRMALTYSLKVMIYTHHTESQFFKILPQLKNQPVFFKFGAYEKDKTVDHYYSHQVKLATSNQYIVWGQKKQDEVS